MQSYLKYVDDSRRELDSLISLPYTKVRMNLLLHFFVTDEVDCENSGWGNTNQERPANNPDELQIVVTPVIAQDQCKVLWSADGMQINDGNIPVRITKDVVM